MKRLPDRGNGTATWQKLFAYEQYCLDTGKTSVFDFLHDVMEGRIQQRDGSEVPLKLRMDAAKVLSPYVYKKQPQAVEVTKESRGIVVNIGDGNNRKLSDAQARSLSKITRSTTEELKDQLTGDAAREPGMDEYLHPDPGARHRGIHTQAARELAPPKTGK